MTIALPVRAGERAGAWPRHLAVLAATAGALLLLFRADVAALAALWWTSTTFAHCLFIPPVVGWLVWTRRGELARLTPVAWLPGLLVVAVGAFAWLVGDAGGIALVRQLALLVMLQGAVAGILGPEVVRGLLFPLGYAFFAVPFGDEIEPPLQDVTVAITMPLLHLVGVPAQVDGVLIHAGRYWFEVAEACSGAKFVIAMIAYGALVANTCFTSWRRRAVFMLVCVVVPVLANGVRAFGTIWAAHLTSVEAATGLDHIVYGWIFFALVMAAVMAVAWRWFDRSPDDPAFDPDVWHWHPRFPVAAPVAGALAIAVAALAPMWSAATAERRATMPARIALPELPGWRRVAMDARAPWSPHYPGADHALLGRYADAQGDAVELAVAAFASQGEGRELIAFGTGALREGDHWIRIADLPPVEGGGALRLVRSAPGGGTVERVVVTWYRVGDMVTSDPRMVKLATIRARLAGTAPVAAALHVSAAVAPGRDPVAAIRRFLAELGAPGDAAARITRTPA